MLYLSQAIGRPVLDADRGAVRQGGRSDRGPRRPLSAGDRSGPAQPTAAASSCRGRRVASFDAAGGRLSTATIDITGSSSAPTRSSCAPTSSTSRSSTSTAARSCGSTTCGSTTSRMLHLVAVDVGAAGLLRRLASRGYRVLARNVGLPPRSATSTGRTSTRSRRAWRRSSCGSRTRARGAPPGRPRHDHRPAGAARPGRRPRLARRRGRGRRDRGDGARHPGRGPRGPRAGARCRHPRGDVARRRGRPRPGPLRRDPRASCSR